MSESIVKAAHEFLSMNIAVIPVGSDKKPLVAWKKYQERLPTAEEIEDWGRQFGDKMQLGIVTGKISNLIVIDVENGGRVDDLPETVRSKTGGGGYHYFYRYTEGLRNGVKMWPQTDIRADGGYVVIPPSVSQKGVYEWITPFSREALAEFPAGFFQRKSILWSGMPKYQGVSEGSRNNELAKYCGKLLSRTTEDAWEVDVQNALHAANAMNTPPLADDEVRLIFASIKEREHDKRTKTAVEYATLQKPASVPEVQTSSFHIETCQEILNAPDVIEPFAVDKLVPEGSITAITADSGKGKSILAMIMAKAIASGEKFLDEFKTKQAKVLLIDQEMAHSVLIARFKKIVVDPTDIFLMSGVGWKVTNTEHREWLKKKVVELGIGVVIMDTLTTVHTADENSASEMRNVNDALLGLCRDLNITLIYLHHHRKMQRGESYGQASSRGSTEILAKVASHLLIDSKDEFNVITGEKKKVMTIEQPKARLEESIPKVSVEIIVDKTTKHTTWQYKGPVSEKETMKEKLKERVTELLRNAPDQTTKMMVTILNAGEKNLRESLKDLVQEGRLSVANVKGTKEKTYSLATLPEQPEIEF